MLLLSAAVAAGKTAQLLRAGLEAERVALSLLGCQRPRRSSLVQEEPQTAASVVTAHTQALEVEAPDSPLILEPGFHLDRMTLWGGDFSIMSAVMSRPTRALGALREAAGAVGK